MGEFMSFDQWLESNPDILSNSQEVDCPPCEGAGKVPDRRGLMYPCNFCHGSGKLKIDGSRIKKGDTLKDIYDRQLASDKKIRERYLTMFPEAGRG